MTSHDIHLSLLIISVRRVPSLFSYKKHIKIFETQMVKWLLNASTVSAKQSATVSLCMSSFYSFVFFKSLFCYWFLISEHFTVLKLNVSKPLPIIELDDSVARDFFTILNISKLYTEDQIFNIYSFSILYTWLHYLHFKATTQSGSERINKSDDKLSTQEPINHQFTSGLQIPLKSVISNQSVF
jgi:hypothetical protein